MTTEKGRIKHSGMGGFLNPPTHPEHTMSVEIDLRRRPENRGGMSLSSAVESEWLADETRAEAARVLRHWQRPALDSPEVQQWIAQVLGYFANCYRNPAAKAGEEWNASNLIIDRERDPVASADDHAGVNLIRKYYPEYAPSAEDFARAKWGK
jgi:hypothetical protein